jgi:hypothetical protein
LLALGDKSTGPNMLPSSQNFLKVQNTRISCPPPNPIS